MPSCPRLTGLTASPATRPQLDDESLEVCRVPLSPTSVPFWCYGNIQLLSTEVEILMRSQENILEAPGCGMLTV